jgi:hypothetical protein
MQIADIQLVNSAGDTLDFVPTWKDGLKAKYVCRQGYRSAVYDHLTIGMRPAGKGVARKVKTTFVLPYDVGSLDHGTLGTDAISGFSEYVIPESATPADIANFLAMQAGISLDPQIQDAVLNGAFPV